VSLAATAEPNRPLRNFVLPLCEDPADATLWFDAAVLKQANANPDSTAIEDRDCSISYRELGQRAQTLAAEVRERIAGQEAVIACLLPPGAEAVTALFGRAYRWRNLVPDRSCAPFPPHRGDAERGKSIACACERTNGIGY